ncbi:MAG: RNA polymerase sigma-70 factor, partial [Chitinophagaceae bacterium]
DEANPYVGDEYARNEEVAEDIIQDVFISLWDKRYILNIQGTISSYLYAAIRYKFFDLVSHQKIRKDYAANFQIYIDTYASPTESHVNEKELIQLIEKEVGKLPDKMREVFQLSRYGGMSHREIAQQLGVSEKTVKNQVNNALKILRKKLGSFTFFLMLIY